MNAFILQRAIGTSVSVDDLAVLLIGLLRTCRPTFSCDIA